MYVFQIPKIVLKMATVSLQLLGSIFAALSSSVYVPPPPSRRSAGSCPEQRLVMEPWLLPEFESCPKYKFCFAIVKLTRVAFGRCGERNFSSSQTKNRCNLKTQSQTCEWRRACLIRNTSYGATIATRLREKARALIHDWFRVCPWLNKKKPPFHHRVRIPSTFTKKLKGASQVASYLMSRPV